MAKGQSPTTLESAVSRSIYYFVAHRDFLARWFWRAFSLFLASMLLAALLAYVLPRETLLRPAIAELDTGPYWIVALQVRGTRRSQVDPGAWARLLHDSKGRGATARVTIDDRHPQGRTIRGLLLDPRACQELRELFPRYDYLRIPRARRLVAVVEGPGDPPHSRSPRHLLASLLFVLRTISLDAGITEKLRARGISDDYREMTLESSRDTGSTTYVMTIEVPLEGLGER
jgi:hypothetical protein